MTEYLQEKTGKIYNYPLELPDDHPDIIQFQSATDVEKLGFIFVEKMEERKKRLENEKII